MENYPLVSVYTCVYNGARTLSRVFDSLKNLDYPNIEHIIVNDGSTDETDALVQEYMQQASYAVKYHKKENGGKHTALNVVSDMAEGEFLLQLDADDRLLPHSVKFLVDTYYQIPEDIRDQYWCVHGRCVTQHGTFVGDEYPSDINNLHWTQAREEAAKCKGDKVGLQVFKYRRQFRFPEVIGAFHIPENIVWNQIDKVYGIWYTNEVVLVYYVHEGNNNLTSEMTTRKQFASRCYWNKWQLEHPEDYSINRMTFVRYALFYFVTEKTFRKHNKYLDGLKKHRAVLSLLFPVAFVGSIVYRILKKVR